MGAADFHGGRPVAPALFIYWRYTFSMRLSVRITGITIFILLAITIGIWSAATQADHRGMLTVSFLSVGRGDAIFIAAPSGRSVLIDGGPDTSVLRALSSVLPWWQRSIDVVVSTSPDKDDSTGLIDVLARYRIDIIVRSSVSGTDSFSRSLADAIDAAQARGADVVQARRGQVIELGSGAYIEILSPDRNVPGVSAADGCVAMRVVYGATSFMLPCDAPQALEEYLAYLDGASLHSDVLKVGKGGAKSSSSELFVGYVSPTYAVYSRACKNLPAEETTATLARFSVETLDTCEGTVTFVSDGESVRVK